MKARYEQKNPLHQFCTFRMHTIESSISPQQIYFDFLLFLIILEIWKSSWLLDLLLPHCLPFRCRRGKLWALHKNPLDVIYFSNFYSLQMAWHISFQDISIVLQQWYNQVTLYLFIIFLCISDISLRALCNTLIWKVKLCQFLIFENYGNIPHSSMIGCQNIWLDIDEGS